MNEIINILPEILMTINTREIDRIMSATKLIMFSNLWLLQRVAAVVAREYYHSAYELLNFLNN